MLAEAGNVAHTARGHVPKCNEVSTPIIPDTLYLPDAHERPHCRTRHRLFA